MQSTTILLSDDNSSVLDHLGKMLEKEKSYKVVGGRIHFRRLLLVQLNSSCIRAADHTFCNSYQFPVKFSNGYC
jgi:hypothetical protein